MLGIWGILRERITGTKRVNPQYLKARPSAQAAIDIFRGEWSSSFAPLAPGLVVDSGGTHSLFDDPRILWAIEQAGGLAGRKVLELGPLEGAHTYLLHSAGASEVVAIEANTRGFLKCLVTKELLGLHRARFLCGDSQEFLRETAEFFDLGVASGVLYHLVNPVEFLELLSRRCRAIYLWTHYYNDALLARQGGLRRFLKEAPLEWGGRRFVIYRHNYGKSLGWSGFCGGIHDHSYWMRREDILEWLAKLGFGSIAIQFDHPDAELPHFSLFARR
jgi:hypothetical protein